MAGDRPAAAGPVEGLVDALVQTSFTTMAVLNRVAADNDLSLTQLRVLAILRDRRLRMSVLASYLGLERSTLSGLVDRAAARDLIARVPDPDDGRAVAVVLTPAGSVLAARMYDQVEQALSPLIQALPSPERLRLQQLLDRLLVVSQL